MEPKTVFKKSSGFALIELIIVLLIVSAIVALITNLPNVFKIIGNSRAESIAKEIAVKKIEDIRSQGYDSIESSDGTAPFTDSRLSSIPNAVAQIIIEPCPASICLANERIKKITAIVSWSESGNPKVVEIVTLIAQNGLQ